MKIMNDIDEKHYLRKVGVCFAFLVFLVTLGSASGAQEKKETPMEGVSVANGEATPRTTDQADRPVPQRRNARYQLCKGDTIDLSFPFSPEFNQTVTIYPDGYTSLTALGDLHIAGQTVPQLRESLKTAYAKILHDPVINIVLKDFEKPYFIAGGEIAHPGKFELRDDITLSQAIAVAGGFNESSKHSQVLLFRRVSKDWVEVKVINVKKMFQARNLSEDPHLQTEDMFFVPQNFISKVRKWIPYTSVSTGINPAIL